ncbi:MAG: preprotein translocase subunit YajC [Candidatus Omnitrophica bacterium]|nr:preprotein translocase subunit YajC [Candidatus Omnitrophota bacterium]MBU1524720.1 preprotein translocase subunit YajC [Candidatus Omnitrophota bacterium]
MQPTPNASILNLVPLIFIFVVFYFLLIRPQQKKQKDHQALIHSLKKNDEVVTGGGIHGTIVNVKEKTFVLRIDENVKVEIDKNSIAYVIKRQ